MSDRAPPEQRNSLAYYYDAFPLLLKSAKKSDDRFDLNVDFITDEMWLLASHRDSPSGRRLILPRLDAAQYPAEETSRRVFVAMKAMKASA